MDEKEEWREIPGFPGYEISSHGRVLSRWKRIAAGKGNGTVSVIDRNYEKIKTDKSFSPAGYQQTSLAFGESGNRKKVTKDIHVLVLEAFRGKRPSRRHEARHLDGNKKNNFLSNLEWGTIEENTADKYTHGTINHGERSGTSKLTSENVHEIRRLVKTTVLTYSSIAKMFGVRESAITRIMKKQRWAHLPERPVDVIVTRSTAGANLIKKGE